MFVLGPPWEILNGEERRGSRGRILDGRNKGQGAVGRPLMVIESCRYVIT